MSSEDTNQKPPVEVVEQGLREEEEEVDYVVVQGQSNADKESREEQDDVEALFLKMMLTESKEKRHAPPRCLFRDSDEQRLQLGKALKEDGLEEEECDKREQRCQEQLQQTLPPSGFDFRHLMVLRGIPLSSFYGLDIDNLNLQLQPSSNVGSFYGLDKESLAAENAALDEFYANIKSEKAAREKDQSSSNGCTQDQS